MKNILENIISIYDLDCNILNEYKDSLICPFLCIEKYNLQNNIVNIENEYYNHSLSFKVINGCLHNGHGPAKSFDNNYSLTLDWYFNNTCYTNEVFTWLENNDIKWENMDEIQFNIMWSSVL